MSSPVNLRKRYSHVYRNMKMMNFKKSSWKKLLRRLHLINLNLLHNLILSSENWFHCLTYFFFVLGFLFFAAAATLIEGENRKLFISVFFIFASSFFAFAEKSFFMFGF